VATALLVFLTAFLVDGITFEESFRAGLVALQRGDLNEAASSLQSASNLAPSNGRVWIALAQTYRRLHEQDKADDAARKASILAPDDVTVLQSLVIYYSESGATLKAADAQERYAKVVPQDPGARQRAETLYFEAAQPLLQHEKFGEATHVLEAARAKFPDSAQIELALGVAYYGLRRFDDAAGAFLRTIAIAPELEQPYAFLGRFLDQIPARLPEATKRFAEYEAVHPSSPVGYLQHARALNALSADPEHAAALLGKAISLNERDASAHFELGTVFDRLGRFEDAAREFGKSAELDPADPAPHYRLSRDYARLGRSADAQSELDKHAQLIRTQDGVR
jgi:Flp pilus assembly protein TadD